MSKHAVILVCAILMLSPAAALPFAPEVKAAESASPRAATEIHDVTELQNVNSNLNGSYALANDIDASDTVNWNGGEGFVPLGNDIGAYQAGMVMVYPNIFNGTFDGRGHKITDLYINRPSNDCVGLFGVTTKNATISDVGLLGLDVTGDRYTGGLAGYLTGNVTNCSSNGTVNATNEGGGLVGHCEYSIISDCHSSATVRGTYGLGGLIGTTVMTMCVISNSYSTGDVSGTTQNIGGFVGTNTRASFIRCYSGGSASGVTGHVGGFFGDDYYGTFTDCHSSGAVSGTNSYIGGFSGWSWGTTMTRCYSTGSVGGNSGTAGGFAGGDYAASTATGCYWDNQTSGKTTSAFGTGKNTTDMMKQATFVGWDFSGTWRMVEGVTYPFLRCLYSPPGISYEGNLTATEGIPYSLRLDVGNFRYPVPFSLALCVTDNAGPWLSFSATTMNFTGTPAKSDYGVYWINVTANDTIGSRSSLNLTLTVLNVNAPPTITSADNISATEDVLYEVQYAAEDIDPTNDLLAWSLSTNASWLEFNGTTGLLSGTPSNSDVGLYRVNVTVDDGHKGRDSHNFTLTVANVNDPPVITTADVTEATQNAPYSVLYAATDIDPTNDKLTWSLDTDAGWLKINATSGRLSGTPGSAEVASFWANVSVSDGHGGSDFHNFTLTVANINDLPTITTVPPTTATEGVLYIAAFNATDPDAGDVHAWSLGTDAEWLDLNATSGVLSGTPQEADVGTVWVSVTVKDAGGASDTLNYKLRVENVNEPPAWVSVPADTTLTEGSPLFLDALAADTDAGTSLRYGISSQPASGISIAPATGAIRWLNATAGNYTVRLNATDGLNTINASFNLTVSRPAVPPPPPPPPVNNPPAINTITAPGIKTGQTLNLKLTGTDRDSYDATNLTFRLVSGPTGMVISADGNVAWTPSKDQSGTHTVSVSLSDGKNTTSSSFVVTVTKAPTTGGTTDTGNTMAMMALLLVVGLMLGAAIGYAATRPKRPTPDDGDGRPPAGVGGGEE